MRCRIFENSNDTPKLNIHKYTNHNIIEIYISRLSTIMQIFIAMDYSIMSEKYFHFRKRQKHLVKILFPTHLVEVTGSMYFGNIFKIMCSSDFPKICIKT